MGDFWEEAGKRKKIHRGLVEGIRDMSGIHIRNEASLVGKGKGVEMAVGETIEGGMIMPCVGGCRDGMMKR